MISKNCVLGLWRFSNRLSLLESTRTNRLNCSYIKPSDDVLKMVKAEKVIRVENRAKVEAVKEDKMVGIMTDDDAIYWKKKMVPEIKEELKKLRLGAHGKKAELVACLEEHLSTELSRAEPSNTEPNNG